MPRITKKEAKNLGLKSGVHALLFLKSAYTIRAAKEWAKSNGFKVIGQRSSNDYIRLTTSPEVMGSTFASKKLESHPITMVFQFI